MRSISADPVLLALHTRFLSLVVLAASLPSAKAMMASTGPRDKGMPEGTLPPSVVGKLPDKPPEYQMNKVGNALFAHPASKSLTCRTDH